MRKRIIVLVLMLVLLLSACSLPKLDSSLPVETTIETIQAARQETTEPKTETEDPKKQEQESSSQPVITPTESVTEKPKEETSTSHETVTESTTPPETTPEKTQPPETRPEVTKLPETTDTGKTNEPVPTDPVAEETVPSTSNPPVVEEVKPTTPSPAESVEPEETKPTEPEFDINYWIGYARSYAQSKGLVLSEAAIDCWDNPIGAGAHCIYLERDIQSRLNRYANDEDITDVWIWAEATGNGRYDLYIGYA